MPKSKCSIKSQIQRARLQLAQVSDAPELDATWLMLHVLGRDESSWLQIHGENKLNPEEERQYAELVKRRNTGEPLAYILGYWEFYGRKFLVNKDVLIPRPSTENLVDAVLAKLHKGMVVADVGTGSGCVIITLALELANFQFSIFNFQLLATDISDAALKIAKENAELHGVADKIEFIRGDMMEALKNIKIDLIVSNPPYVPTKEILPFEPALALNGGKDGQYFIRQIKASGIPAIVEGMGGKINFYT
ncbi:MAG: peptide chain release factor N(5)-glutamine methyltransferase [bacterium]